MTQMSTQMYMSVQTPKKGLQVAHRKAQGAQVHHRHPQHLVLLLPGLQQAGCLARWQAQRCWYTPQASLQDAASELNFGLVGQGTGQVEE